MTPDDDWEGKRVSEEEVAAHLGFSSVVEMRRWQTEIGQQLAQTEEELRIAKQDAAWFRWTARRMKVVLEKSEEVFKTLRIVFPGMYAPTIDDILLAIDVVLGRSVDWQGRLDGWFPTKEEIR